MKEFLIAGAICLIGTSPAEAKLTSPSEYAKARQGIISYALIKGDRNSEGFHSRRVYPSASLSKAMIAVQYLRIHRNRKLTTEEKQLLDPMIRQSDNDAASALFSRIGRGVGLSGLAKKVGMKEFKANEWWGDTGISARDQARFFWRLESLLPKRHRSYGKYLFSNVVPYQHWGIPRAFLYWKTYFKGGWRPQDRAIMVNQAALLKLRSRKAVIVVLTKGNPSYEYGHQTIEGIARRLKAKF